MYVVKIESRAPEGIRGYKQFRLTEAGSDQLAERMRNGASLEELVAGLEAEPGDSLTTDAPFETPAEPAAAKRSTTKAK